MTTHIPDPPAELEIGKKTRNTTDGSVETTPEKIEETSKVGSIMQKETGVVNELVTKDGDEAVDKREALSQGKKSETENKDESKEEVKEDTKEETKEESKEENKGLLSSLVKGKDLHEEDDEPDEYKPGEESEEILDDDEEDDNVMGEDDEIDENLEDLEKDEPFDMEAYMKFREEELKKEKAKEESEGSEEVVKRVKGKSAESLK